VYLRSLHLQHFRNYGEAHLAFTAGKTILVGENAQGKTNVLEAVQLLATGRSLRALRDREMIRHGVEEGRIGATVERRGVTFDLEIILRSGRRRTLRLNGETQRRQADVLGYLNCVSFSSLDLDLVRGGPEARRHWLDGILLQIEPVYVGLIEQYQQVLQQRNALLRQGGDLNPEQLLPWDALLIRLGSQVSRRRHRLIARLAPLAAHWHGAISGEREQLHLAYRPRHPFSSDDPQAVQEAFAAELARRAALERLRGSTLVGPHRDEVDLTIDTVPARQYGSQGQQRTLVLALKLAELDLIEQVAGEVPLLLLDDVLAELDLKRQDQLLGAIGDRVQTVVTTTHLGQFDSQWLRSATVLSVHAGSIAPQTA
jgi:DNA replication and repair protein RecF